MIKSEDVKVERARLYCDKCGTEMVFDGMVYTTDPPKYPHTCPNCRHEDVADAIYPTIVYK